MYYFIDWKKTETGTCAGLPDGIGYALLAEPHEEDTYAVFEAEAFDVSVEEALRYHIQPVSEELADLLRSAEVYPPALAIARDEVRRVSGATRTEFGEALASCLRRFLTSQRDSPFFLAEAKQTERGYKYAGSFYWIVGYRPGHRLGEVQWVSRDFFVYQSALKDFDCDRAFLEKRFPQV